MCRIAGAYIYNSHSVQWQYYIIGFFFLTHPIRNFIILNCIVLSCVVNWTKKNIESEQERYRKFSNNFASLSVWWQVTDCRVSGVVHVGTFHIPHITRNIIQHPCIGLYVRRTFPGAKTDIYMNMSSDCHEAYATHNIIYCRMLMLNKNCEWCPSTTTTTTIQQ